MDDVVGWTLAIFALLALIAFAIGVLACRGFIRKHFRLLNRLEKPYAIDQTGLIPLGGIQQWVNIRGRDRSNPILLFLHGGPGSVFSGLAYSYQTPWEEYFTVVNWDQRGAGRSPIPKGDKVGLETLVSDTIELIDYLRRELGHEKVILLGHSWGGFLGLNVARRRPELLHAFVGLAPLLGIRPGYRETHRVLTEAASKAGDKRALTRLRKAGSEMPNPTDASYLPTLRAVLGLLPEYGMSWRNQRSGVALLMRILTISFLSPDLKLGQVFHPLGASPSYVLPLFREIHDMYLPEVLGRRFETTMILISGEHDQQSPHALVRDYAVQIEAPRKAFRVLRGSAHAAVWEAPGQILAALLEDARPHAATCAINASDRASD
jgi:pimeloyl-ACP methyl ester carboxylesterase